MNKPVLAKCMDCGSDDLTKIFPTDSLECGTCEARHHFFDGEWRCHPNDSGRWALEAQQATVPDEFEGDAT